MRISDWSSDVCSSDLREKVRGSSKAVAAAGPRPGKTPTSMPKPVPRTAKNRLEILSAVLKPLNRASRLSMPISLSWQETEWRSQVAKHPARPEIDRHCRSEEHTSELQSLMRISYAVFFLKKK